MRGGSSSSGRPLIFMSLVRRKLISFSSSWTGGVPPPCRPRPRRQRERLWPRHRRPRRAGPARADLHHGVADGAVLLDRPRKDVAPVLVVPERRDAVKLDQREEVVQLVLDGRARQRPPPLRPAGRPRAMPRPPACLAVRAAQRREWRAREALPELAGRDRLLGAAGLDGVRLVEHHPSTRARPRTKAGGAISGGAGQPRH